MLYNYASAANNNGSAFAGQGTGTDWYTITQGLAMLIGRFFLIIPALAIGGSLVRKQKVPATAGTFPTDTPLFGGLVVGAIFIVAGLTFFPALALGPIVEQLSRTDEVLVTTTIVPEPCPPRCRRPDAPPKVRRGRRAPGRCSTGPSCAGPSSTRSSSSTRGRWPATR